MSPEPAAVEAAPYPFAFDPAVTALVIIDMQRDFLYPGGFGELLGNDVEMLLKVVEPLQVGARRRAGRRDGRHPHARGTPHRPHGLPAEQARARQPPDADRRRGPERPHPRPRRARARDHRRARADRGRGRARQARQGRVLRDRPRSHPAQRRHHAPRRDRRHDRGLRAHDRARGQRPRLRVPRAVGLRRLLLPRVPRGRPADDRRAGRDLRLGRLLAGSLLADLPTPVVAFGASAVVN